MDIHTMVEQVKKIVESKGFEEVAIRNVGYRPEGYSAGYNVELYIKEGGESNFEHFSEPEWPDVINRLNGIRSREYRDLERLAKKIGEIEGMKDSLESVYAAMMAQYILDITQGDVNRVLADMRKG